MTIFTRTRWAVAVAAVLGVSAMFLYPGGTARDPSTKGYSLFQNFLSDLGATTSYNGQRNTAGAVLFVASLGILVVSLGSSMVGLIRLYSASPRARMLSRLAGVAGALVGASFIGVAVTPENRAFELHLRFTLLAFRLFPIVTLLFAIATLRADVPRRIAGAWVVLTLALIGYVAMLSWGPEVTTSHQGLTIQVTAQKTIAVVALAVLTYQTYEADRLLAARTGDSV